MQNTPVISNQKIIMFVMFVFAAIMTSVMVYHLRNQTVVTSANSNEALIFPDARDIKPFTLITADNQKFSLDNFKDHWTLVFFGFTHCASICPTTLSMISKTYSDLQREYPSLQVVLVSLDPDRDTPSVVTQYAQSYNSAFVGVTGKLEELRKLQSQLGIYSERTPNTTDGNYQIEHTSSIMLINPKGQWAGMFKFGMNPTEFRQVFMESVKG